MKVKNGAEFGYDMASVVRLKVHLLYKNIIYQKWKSFYLWKIKNVYFVGTLILFSFKFFNSSPIYLNLKAKLITT